MRPYIRLLCRLVVVDSCKAGADDHCEATVIAVWFRPRLSSALLRVCRILGVLARLHAELASPLLAGNCFHRRLFPSVCSNRITRT